VLISVFKFAIEILSDRLDSTLSAQISRLDLRENSCVNNFVQALVWARRAELTKTRVEMPNTRTATMMDDHGKA